MYLNKVQLIGNITQDLELANSSTSLLPISLATNRSYKDKNQDKQEETEFHNLVAFGRTAEVMAEYLQKGDQIYVEGRLQTRSWENDQGEKRYKTQIVVEQFQFGQKSQKNQGQGQGLKEKVKEEADTVNLDEIPF